MSSMPRAATVRTAESCSPAIPPASAYASWIFLVDVVCTLVRRAPAAMMIGEVAITMIAMSQRYQPVRTTPAMPIPTISTPRKSFDAIPSSMFLIDSPIRVESSSGLFVSYQPTSWRTIALRYAIFHRAVIRSLQ